ncbi:putative isomerase YbhE [Agrocybe pediades]|nr:putative isomerase YbhE [Agrocybe pediades]
MYSYIGPEEVASEQTVYHILSGSFKSLSLFLLAFSPANRTLSHLQSIPAFGPHQYLATNAAKDRVYTTSWALPPSLSSWQIDRSSSLYEVKYINTVPITATSSYLTIPAPYTHVYSVGGPTGESHLIDPDTGGFGEKVQEILFVPEHELEKADKTRVALRYGSHGIEFTPSRQFAFVPVLGTNSIEMYSHDSENGRLSHIASISSPRGVDANDGPRHLKIHPNGKVLYCITEHSNYVDSYRILPTTLEYIDSRSVLPKTLRGHGSGAQGHFRGDTLMLPPSTPSSPAPKVLITTTRYSNSNLRGWLSVFPLGDEGNFTGLPESVEGDTEAERFETPTSGGKANAIDILSKAPDSGGSGSDGLWILLTDDDDITSSPSGTGAVRVLEWNGWDQGGVKVVAEWPSVDDIPNLSEDRIQGASHAIWLD